MRIKRLFTYYALRTMLYAMLWRKINDTNVIGDLRLVIGDWRLVTGARSGASSDAERFSEERSIPSTMFMTGLRCRAVQPNPFASEDAHSAMRNFFFIRSAK